MNEEVEFKKILSDALAEYLINIWDSYLKLHSEATMANTCVGDWLEFIADKRVYPDNGKEL